MKRKKRISYIHLNVSEVKNSVEYVEFVKLTYLKNKRKMSYIHMNYLTDEVEKEYFISSSKHFPV